MAQVAKKNNDLVKKYLKLRLWMVIGYVVCGICFIAFPFLGQREVEIVIMLLNMSGFLGGCWFGLYMSHKANALYAGIVGENITADLIRTLPECYCGFQNLKITVDGKTSELDMVVVGPTGVFVIETKNLNGTIVGNYNNTQWSQKKVGRQGTAYAKTFYNPIKQVGTHVYRLAKFLESNGIHTYVNSMVYFSNPDTVIQLFGEPTKTPVFSALKNSEKEIAQHITNREQSIANEQVIQIATLLNNYNA